MFPKLRQATFSARTSAALFVLFVHRTRSHYTHKLFLNTPDRSTGSEVTHKDVHAAFERANIYGYLGVTRHNYNVFTVEFDRHQRREAIRISLPAKSHGASDHLEVQGEFMLPEPPRLFACDVTHLSVDPDTIPERVCSWLAGPRWSPAYSLLIQETRDPLDARLIYVLRFSLDSVGPGIEKFYFPLDADESDNKIWGVFEPIPVNQVCIFCRRKCQRDWSNVCPFATVVGGSSGVH